MARIVFVDDEADMLGTLRDAFTELGHEVHTAEDGREGLRLILDKEPDLAFVDMRLGGMKGMEILREVKAQKPGIKTIMLTGYNDSQIDADAMKHGALMCLHKPVGLKELADIIEKYA
ncbi:MAG TPA: response regulator [Candidatus Omnitrophota bacterium]|jgi:DNA-binding NtrC family response regulator|nr:MAG: Sporulation initiation phosphotransferase F [Candidatus Omnitrophica bacterium ADurb.Bin314]HOE68682.1 response regulator [Candidatus Omnitrophota bacterium]HPW64965.1 response regulator [Candidatus Omnitrophota bacterium]HQB94040.1 response regulator [Candidatus Omnitrophota bacterium]